MSKKRRMKLEKIKHDDTLTEQEKQLLIRQLEMSSSTE